VTNVAILLLKVETVSYVKRQSDGKMSETCSTHNTREIPKNIL